MEINISIKDDRGYSQGFRPSEAMTIRTERRCDAIISEFKNTKDVKILEIGCGTGEMSNLLAQKTGQQVLGTDICEPFIESARQNYKLPNLNLVVLDFNNKQQTQSIVGDTKFDYIVGNGILHHFFYQLDETLGNIKNLLNSSGKIIFWEPNILNPYCLFIFKTPVLRKMAYLEPNEMAFSKKFIAKKLTDLGYQNIKVSYRDFLLPNTPKHLIRSVIKIGDITEKTPLKFLSQSIFIVATKQSKVLKI
ncbi:MAG: hypothetical protein A2655_01965 [Candidatus Yanofskybacteria bacterium RIFCSPHIGHO2_01_FULL_43_42]|uniref:Methyltransferase domain-containing protein n=1 Tax=Candidatus Yanofskybacteria bacterium RIFCSPLOWO2_01_FULL_43_22 TaxID=1802695 RepID=A0A1F8GH74_9BACT|nr:MAG: hypothetical protein A2655_01965 [Candidatus Yanofskybacteria bacterium RIFCSPHIGHO2_01_FULL_43_42]OGN13236.1 MAG: hypothetical protein A3D48_02870 [Candidatus Yanofskybacteria bacterium RIFCSPHIGHO2_02_FULL_43_17]OGN24651.1 MAG: hypothetical protein A3A13_01095 [Candidatus Yanofskybacteria bacterium RIFCSPLOWO2_01_FULL_43_22]